MDFMESSWSFGFANGVTTSPLLLSLAWCKRPSKRRDARRTASRRVSVARGVGVKTRLTNCYIIALLFEVNTPV